MSRFAIWFALSAAAAILAGCGSGQAIPTVPVPATSTTTGPVVSTIQLLVSNPQMSSKKKATVDLTAVVLTATKQTVSGKTVTFTAGSATDTAFVNNISASGVSDANGLVTATLNIGDDRSNRTISVSATTENATGTNSVDVTGTTITVSGSSSLSFGASTKLTFAVKDSAGDTLPNVKISLASKTGNTITPSSGTTDASGQFAATITATQSGNDTITASAAGATTSQDLTISSASFAFTAPTAAAGATSIDIPLNTATTASVNWKNAGTAVSGSAVNFSISRGAITAASTTNASGDTPGVTFSSASAGTAILTASGATGTPAATLSINFVATTASSVAVQAVPSTVQVTTGSAAQTSNSATISVVVRDIANNLVKNASVDFKVTIDPSGGALSSGSAITDVNGSASVTYTAGTTSSPSNGVTVQATVNKIGGVPMAIPITSTTTLTVAGQSLLVRLGTDNQVNSSAPINNKTYAAVVTDSAGNASVNTTVRFALRPGRYRKGFYTWDAVNSVWAQTVTATCINEDTNYNGIMDPVGTVVNGVTVVVSEDTNSNGSLEPGNVATVTGSGVTGTNGVATTTITYPKDHATWVEQVLEGRTGVIGNDPPAQAPFWLPGLAADYTTSNSPPPGVVSPYGRGALCTDTN